MSGEARRAGRRGVRAGDAVALLALATSLAAVGWAAAHALALDNAGNLAAWFLVVLIGHDLVFLPLYSGLHRLATASGHTLPARRRAVPAINHLRAPAGFSALCLLIYAPLILGLGTGLYRGATGRSTAVYLDRWLGVTAAVFAGSAALYAARLVLARRRHHAESAGGATRE